MNIKPISASRSQAIDSTRWVRLCLNRAKASEKKRKAQEEFTHHDLERLMSRGLTPVEIDAISTRRCDAVRRRTWHQLWEKSMPTSLQQ